IPVPERKAVLIAYFDSKYNVTIAEAKRGAHDWTIEKLSSIRTVSSIARGDVDGDGKPDLIVGRFYGDDKGIDGDAFVLAPDLARRKPPSTGGMLSLAFADGAFFLGAGWNQDSAAQAHALLSWSLSQNAPSRRELIKAPPGQSPPEKTAPATIKGA